MKFIQRMRMLPVVLLTGAAMVSGVRADGADKALAPTSRIDLFNGRDFTGLKLFLPTNTDVSKTWIVTNGVLWNSGKPTGYLRTAQEYRDYRLTVEWRFVKVAPKADNTGVMVHIQGPDKVWPPCIQFQGRHDKQGDLFLMAGAESIEHKGRDSNTPVAGRNPSVEKAVGEWNTCVMECRGDSVKAFNNGEKVNEITGCTVVSGSIGIQSEGGEIEIRRMFVEPLKP